MKTRAMITKTMFVIVFTLQLFFVKGQTEFLTTVNPTTGNFSIIDSLPGVNFIYGDVTAYDRNNKRYIFKGIDFGGNSRLYCIDATSGAILSQPLFNINVGEFQYDNASNTLFGLYIDNGLMFLISIDISAATTSIITTLPVLGMSSGTTSFDEVNGNFILQSSGSFYSINVNTGNIVANSAPTSFSELQFNNVSGKLYGLYLGSTTDVVDIDISAGTYSTIATMPVMGYASTLTSFDEMNNIYTYSASSTLFSVDVNSGAIVSSPTFPVVLPGENIIELHYDNANGTLYGLHWGAIRTTVGVSNNVLSTGAIFNIYPNPVSTQLTIDTELDADKIEILDITGETIKSYIPKTNAINVSSLPNGIYFIKLITAEGSITKRFVKQ